MAATHALASIGVSSQPLQALLVPNNTHNQNQFNTTSSRSVNNQQQQSSSSHGQPHHHLQASFQQHQQSTHQASSHLHGSQILNKQVSGTNTNQDTNSSGSPIDPHIAPHSQHPTQQQHHSMNPSQMG